MGKLRPYHLKPYDENISQAHADFLDWVQTTLNALVGQKLNTTGQGFAGLQNPTLNPATQLASIGGRTSIHGSNAAITSPTATSITFNWDGTNGSTVFILSKDDGTSTTPIVGSQNITGLTNGHTFTFYPYYDVISGNIRFVSLPGFIGVPNIAHDHSAFNNTIDLQARQQASLSSRVPLWTLNATSILGPWSSGPPTLMAGAVSGLFLRTRTGSGY